VEKRKRAWEVGRRQKKKKKKKKKKNCTFKYRPVPGLAQAAGRLRL
jgi:hypothetical protein